MRIIVIGAGIGGLVTAIALQRDGHEVTVFERRAEPTGIGAGLSLFGNAFAGLDALGLGEVVRGVSTGEIGAMRAGHRRPNGRWLSTIPQRSLRSLRSMHRADLHRALVAQLVPGSLRVGVAGLAAPDGAPQVTGDGPPEDADLVIVADGIHSPNRRRLGLDTGLRYAGYVAWRGVTSTPVDLTGEAGIAWGRGRHFGMAPLPGGHVYWFATANTPRHGTPGDELGRVRAMFTGWHDPIAELLDATEPDAVLRHEIEDLARPLRTFVRDRTVLLGDAAHGMTPDLGQGAGQVIEDAATLVLLLRSWGGRGPLSAVLALYDRLRVARTRRILLRSRRAGRLSRMEGRLISVAREAVVRAMPSAVIGRVLESQIAWSPPGPFGR